MDVFSILNLHDVEVKNSPRDAFFTDLNLTPIIEEISNIWGRDVLDFYRYFPYDKESEAYRREVLKDLKAPDVYETFLKGWLLIQDSKDARERGEKARQGIQKSVWLVNEVAYFCEAVSLAYNKVNECFFESYGMNTFKTMIKAFVESDRFKKMSESSLSIREQINSAQFTLTYDNSRVVFTNSAYSDTEGCDGSASRLIEALMRLKPDAEPCIRSPFADNDDLVGMEYELVQLFLKKNPEISKNVQQFYKDFHEYGAGWIFRFFEELTFYLSFIKFTKSMEDLGAVFSIPSEDDAQEIKATGLYDLALFITNNKRGKVVVSNDFLYEEDEQFFVLTGPNQGGKTTFARSLGQLVFFTKMGLMVPAESANLHYFSSLVTHFSVEESVETGRGKLMEELVRLAPMMEHSGENSFVIINELFTTAANYDAVIMRKRVLSHFIKNGCHGIYVTHLTELIDFEKKAVGLCAELNEQGRQTYKIRKEVMEYTNCATNQVNKYDLTYESLKERLQ